MRWSGRSTTATVRSPAPAWRQCPQCQRDIRGFQCIMKPAEQPIRPGSLLYHSTVERVVPICRCTRPDQRNE